MHSNEEISSFLMTSRFSDRRESMGNGETVIPYRKEVAPTPSVLDWNKGIAKSG